MPYPYMIMVVSRDPESARKPAPETGIADDCDWTGQIPSIWDTGETQDPYESDILSDQDVFAPPIPMAARRPAWFDPQVWMEAEHRAGRALADAAEAVGRLDERLRRVSEATRQAWRERLALEDISGLLWAEGVRLRAETLALADADRLGRTEDDDRIIARGQWALRRLTGQGNVPRNAEEMPAFLGRAPRSAEALSGESAWTGLSETLIPPGPDSCTASPWCAAMDALEDAHPLTRSAVAFHLWRGLGLSGPEIWLEPGVVAARIAATGARGGLSVAPLMAGSGRALTGHGGGAGERLTAWLSGLTHAAGHAQMALDRIEAWHEAACDRATGFKGKGAPALIGLLAARPIVSARDVAAALAVSTVQARTLLNRLHALGLIRELTGHTRFRYWTAIV